VKIGDVMRSGAGGRVVKSRSPRYAEGDLVVGMFGWQDYAVVKTDAKSAPTKVLPGVPLELAMSTLGMTGITAYFGLLEVGRPLQGETVVVSGAAGAVGSAAGQMAKIKGAARVIGIAGGEEKCRWLVEELGFDAAIDYKAQDVRRALREAAPDGVDVYFDNVGGEILDAVLTRLARGARIVICGAVSQYNSTDGVRGPSNYLSLLVARASMIGMVVFDHAPRFGEAAAEIAGWMREGRLISREHIVEGGVSAFPETLLKLFTGENVGKLVLRVGPN
jgi:hypothetical protein